MIDGQTIYWITRMDAVCAFLSNAGVGACVIAGIAFCVAAVFWCLAKADDEDGIVTIAARVMRYALPGVVLGLLLLLGRVFVPTTKELAAIYVIPAVANNEQVQDEASELYGLAKEWLRQQVDNDD